MSAECWRRHPEHLDYEISSLGRVRRLTAARGTRIGKILKPGIRKDGYPLVVLDGKSRLLHQLVLEAFRGPRPAGLESRHDDDIKANCSLSNLFWGTRRENMFDRAKNGAGRYGSKSTQAKLREEDVKKIHRRSAAGETNCQLAQAFDVSASLISKIVRRERWRHVQ